MTGQVGEKGHPICTGCYFSEPGHKRCGVEWCPCPCMTDERGEDARLSRREWEVRSIPDHGEAVRLIKAWHYSGGAPNTSTYRHGLYRRGELLSGDAWGVAMWIPPTRTAGEALAGDDWQGVLSLSRLAIDPTVPTNGASFLMAASIRLIPADRWPVLVTYADTGQGHTGAIYRATNWHEDGPVPAGDVWEGPDGRLMGRKRGGVTLTVADMLAAGFTRRPALPKIRFVLDRRSLRRPLAAVSGEHFGSSTEAEHGS